jgi:hypothetical protein
MEDILVEFRLNWLGQDSFTALPPKTSPKVFSPPGPVPSLFLTLA